MNVKLSCERRFCFSDISLKGINDDVVESEETNELLIVTIREIIEPDFSSYVWPSSVVLAQYIWYNRAELSGKSFLEIGCGTALPSIVALKCVQPKFIILTDKICSARQSLLLNDVADFNDHFDEKTRNDSSVHLLPLTWGDVSLDLMDLQSKLQPEIILGSDCFYEPLLFEDVLSSVYFLLKSFSEASGNQSTGKFYCTYQTRNLDWTLAPLLRQWNLKCVHIPLKLFGADRANIALSNLPGNHVIQMLEITLV